MRIFCDRRFSKKLFFNGKIKLFSINVKSMFEKPLVTSFTYECFITWLYNILRVQVSKTRFKEYLKLNKVLCPIIYMEIKKNIFFKMRGKCARKNRIIQNKIRIFPDFSTLF